MNEYDSRQGLKYVFYDALLFLSRESYTVIAIFLNILIFRNFLKKKMIEKGLMIHDFF